MSPSARTTSSESNSTGSSGSEDRVKQVGERVSKRKRNNRDAARKSRKKQTEKADELHKELQHLEQANSTLEKEIGTLRRELHLYTTALKHHEPHCTLTTVSSLPAAAAVATDHLQTPCSSLDATLSLSVSIASSGGLRALDCVKSTLPSASAVVPTTTTISEHFATSTVRVSHSLLSEQLPLSPPLVTSSVASVTSLSAHFTSNSTPSTISTTTVRPKPDQKSTYKSSSLSAHSDFLTFQSVGLGDFPKQSSTPVSSHDVSNIMPPYSPLVPSGAENAGLVAHDCSTNALQLQPNQFNSTPEDSGPSCTLWPPIPQEPSLHTPSVASQIGLDPSTNPAFALKLNYGQELTPNSPSLLSLLTTPSPLVDPLTTSTSFDGPPCLHLSSLFEPSRDISFSELLEGNDWILGGAVKP